MNLVLQVPSDVALRESTAQQVARPLDADHIAAVRALCPTTSRVETIDAYAVRFLDVDQAAGDAQTRTAVEHYCASKGLDASWVPARPLSAFRLLAMDMDSTLITIECIDEIADFCGLKAEVSAITEAAMRGEIPDFSESLRRRVALLQGLEAAVLERVYEERVRLSPGAETLLAGARAAGLKTLLVSGGFTFFTEKLRARLGLDAAYANTLEIVDGKLTGRVLGEIVDGAVKARHVVDTCAAMGVAPETAIAMGDGSNDLPMMAKAGLSVAYRAKPKVRAGASVALDHAGLDGVLRLFV